MPHHVARMAVGLWVLACAGGCAVWQEPWSEPSRLPAAKMSVDSVVLEVGFVHVPPDQKSQVELIWRDVDEQHLSTELRRKLAANGLRCGLVGAQLPTPLRTLLDQVQPSPLAEADGGAAIGTGVTTPWRRLQARSGRRNEIVTAPLQEKLVVLMQDEGSVRGETYTQAQCLLALRCYPQGDGRVRLELTPEIVHGAPKNHFVGQDGMFRMESGRQQQIFEALRTEALLAPGQTLLISATGELKGLGQRYFADLAASPGSQKLLLIRLAQTQYDDLFSQPMDASLVGSSE